MNKVLIPAGIVVLGAGVFAFMYVNGQKPKEAVIVPNSQTVSSTTPAAQTATAGQTFTGTMAELLKRGSSARCEAKFKDGNSDFSGTYYIDTTGRAAIDVSMAAKGEDGKGIDFLTHMIVDREFMYTWQDGATTGMKISTDLGKGATGTTGGQQNDQLNKKMDFSCSPWDAEPSKFEIPKGVSFADMTAGLKGIAGTPGDAASALENLKSLGVTLPPEK